MSNTDYNIFVGNGLVIIISGKHLKHFFLLYSLNGPANVTVIVLVNSLFTYKFLVDQYYCHWPKWTDCYGLKRH